MTDELYHKLNHHPAVLFLGQNYLAIESGRDLFINEVKKKYGRDTFQSSGYFQLFETDVSKAGLDALAWMSEKCPLIAVPQWLNVVSQIHWSGVYTSAIDTIWPRAFRSDWRDLQPIFEEKFRPNDPRNRIRMHCTYLFGSVNRTDKGETPPLSRIEWLSRKQEAISLLRRLPEIVTPFGVLLIEGYVGSDDWLVPEDFLPTLNLFGSEQVYFFSANERLINDPIIRHLVEQDKAVLFNESLASFISHGIDKGELRILDVPEQLDGHPVSIGEGVLVVPPDIWKQVSRTALILDDSIITPPTSISKDRLYLEFRNFLADSGTTPAWDGYERGFAFFRHYAEHLYKITTAALLSTQKQEEPFILHGQSGTGKTIALRALAHRIRKAGVAPVLFIERRSQRPLYPDIDNFCKWAEDAGAPATLVIWDGMIGVDQYHDILQYLLGRGRKAVLVGSSYKETEVSGRGNYVEASIEFSTEEKREFLGFLEGFGRDVSSYIQERLNFNDNTFLVALYRILPPTRVSLRTGIVREFDKAERDIQRLAENYTENEDEDLIESALGRALMAAGLVEQVPLITEQEIEIGGEHLSELQALIGLVMVPGRFGLQVPLELLLRSCGKSAYTQFIKLLQTVDVFRWYEDVTGNIAIGPRHPLEAELFCQARLGGAKTEVEFINRLLLELRNDETISGGNEVQFGVDLIQRVGPNSSLARYIPFFQDISNTLQRLRNERSVVNPRLMLQEATLLRGFVVENSISGVPPENTELLLEHAESVLLEALRFIERQQSNNKLRGIIYVELGATLGARARFLLDTGSHPQLSVPFFAKVREQIFRARAADPDSYYPIDVLAWTSRDILRANVLDVEARAEVEADLLHAFEMAETEDFGLAQQERFQTRRMEIGSLLGRHEISDSAFKLLLNQGSPAGIYLRASQIAGKLPKDEEEITEEQLAQFKSAVEYLNSFRTEISKDGRCLYLLLRLWWVCTAKRPLFYKERQAVPFTIEDWKICLDIISSIMAASEIYVTPSLRYIQGLAQFHVRDIDVAFETFKELERDSDFIQGRRRIIRSYLASNSDGKAKIYNGTVSRVSENRGEIYVEEIRRHVRFIPADFSRRDFRRHEAISGFNIAFNFLGPIIDPALLGKS